ncbi:histidine kinase [Marinomonas ushuaiensis DSM 15871]|uniref:Sensor protein FixL n=1 Tax=Marinomonas ushuaiensis DSM 15871 TaxID=1122207 RepID=X7E953_9GAMM|nr:PAS domain S-box protein [Marinomonas ushuaiensis]ETX12365.1 histidine kinase [Marinomonas ushuaiensis DSM 15871]
MNWLQDFFVFDMTNYQTDMGTYNYWLVFLSILLSSSASFFSLHFASVAQHIATKKHKNIAVISGSFVMAGGIWSMHFVGMLAYDMGHSVSYEPWLTLFSIIPSVIASYITLNLLIKDQLSPWELVFGGTIVGLGIGTMHYMGMAAMEMNVILRYDPYWFALSIVVAAGLAIIALATRYYILKIYPNLHEGIVNALGATIMGAAISGMHYTGMTGARYISLPNSTHDQHMHHMQQETGVDNYYLSLAVSVATLLISILATNIASQLRYRQLLLEKTSNELRLSTTLDTAVDGIITIDHKGTIQEFNNAAESIFGWSEVEVIGQNVSILMPEPYQREHDSYLSNYRNTGFKKAIGIEQEVTALHRDGHIFPIRLGIGEVKLDGFDPLFVGFVTDISARRAMEETIRKNEEQYSSLIKNIPGASFRCKLNTNWDILFISDAIEKLSGWKVEDFHNGNASLADLIHPEDNEKLLEAVNVAKNGNGTYTVEYRSKHKNGHYLWVLENGSLAFDENNEPQWIDGVILDISSRIEMEVDLRQAKLKAEQSAESKSAFLANMSHEIRTPMNAIIGFSDILLESDISAENKKHLSTISKSGRALLHLLNDILDSAKLDKNKLELDELPFDLMNMVDTVISTLWLQAKTKNVDLSFTIEDSVGKAYLGAEGRIHQVLMNLIGNAIKFTEIGSVTLDISRQENGDLRFAVTDTGIGIPAERLHKIFDPFTQADASMSRRFGGTGLGTTISKQLVELMGGQIHATSELNVGSCFYVDLPLKEAELVPVNKEKSNLMLASKRILIADDVEQNITLLTIILQRQGHEVHLAEDGAEVVTQFKKLQPDLILMDIQMPVMDGLTATQIIRTYEKDNSLSRTPIIALTANVLLEDKLEAQRAGMDGFANKPIDVNALTIEMARVLNVETIEQEVTELDQSEVCVKKQINFEKGLKLWGEVPVYLTELGHFLALHNSLIETLKRHLENKAFSEIHTLAHAIKGSSSNLALLTISKQATAIEGAAKAENGTECFGVIQKLEDYMASFEQELDELSSTHLIENADNDQTTYQKMSKEALLELIDELIKLTSAGEVDDPKIDYFVANICLNMKSKAIGVRNALLDFDFDAASAILIELKTMIEEAA